MKDGLKITARVFSKEFSFLGLTLIIFLAVMGCSKLKRFDLDGINSSKIPCNCIMDTLKGEWSWFKTRGGHGLSDNNRFKSVIKILSQNQDGSINYELWVKDTLFVCPVSNGCDGIHNGIFVEDTLLYKGSFQFQHFPTTILWGGFVDIKLPHTIPPRDDWSMYLDYDMEFIDDKFQRTRPRDTLIFEDGVIDGIEYHYKKIKKY